MRTGMLLGLLGVVAGVTAAALALLVYVVNGVGAPTNPYAARLGLGVAAFILALLIGIGAALLRARSDLGAVLMIAGSISGTLAISAFNAGPTALYALSVPLSLLGALVALLAAAPTPSVAVLRWLTLLLLAAGVAAGFRFGGLLGAVAFAVPFFIAGALVLTRQAGRGPA